MRPAPAIPLNSGVARLKLKEHAFLFLNEKMSETTASNDSHSPLTPVQTSQTPSQRFEEYLQSRGMRNTGQRRILLEEVFSYHDHFDADDLIEKLPRKGEAGYVSRPTVYRTLKEFVEAGLLSEFKLEGRSVYEHDYGYPDHDHLYCTECQTLIEFDSEEIRAIREMVARSHNFQAASHKFIISGICESCRAAKNRKRRRLDRI